MRRGKRVGWYLSFLLVSVVSFLVLFPSKVVFAQKFPQTYVNHKEKIKGGTLKVGYPSNTTFKGIFMSVLSADSKTGELASFGETDLFMHNKEGKFIKGGLADITFDRQAKTANISISKKARWSDGYPVTARDMVFVYEIVADPNSTSEYYDDGLEDIKGMKEFHEGKAHKISGLEVKDDKHLVIHYQKMVPAMEYVSSAYLFNEAQPYHYLKNVPIAKLAACDQVRKRPIFYGPYTVSSVVQGESVSWVPNKYYGGPKPKLSKITVEVVPTAQIAQAMHAKKYDVILHESNVTYVKTGKLDDYVTLGNLAYGLKCLGFRVGHENKQGRSVLDKNLPTNNRALRLAVAYAMNVSQVLKEYGLGLEKRANTMVSPAYGVYHDSSLKPYPFSLKKANALLDKAGFKRGKDGYRKQPNGKKLTLHLLISSSGGGNEEVAQNYMQQWKKVGLRVKLVNGRGLEFNQYEEKLHNNARDYDMWVGKWSLGQEPSSAATAAYSPMSQFNHGHFVTKENTQLLASLNSVKAFNEKYRINQMHKWQTYMQKEAYVLPLSYNYDLTAVAKNVTGYSVSTADRINVWDQVALTK